MSDVFYHVAFGFILGWMACSLFVKWWLPRAMSRALNRQREMFEKWGRK